VQCRPPDLSRARPARRPAALQTTTTDNRHQRAKQYWLIRRASNNATNLQLLTRHHALQHGDCIVAIDYCDVISPYLFDERTLVQDSGHATLVTQFLPFVCRLLAVKCSIVYDVFIKSLSAVSIRMTEHNSFDNVDSVIGTSAELFAVVSDCQ